ncbi:MAG: proton-conducting transporter membrane subunit [Pseudomonadota bacterium]|nr:proton-conducting transporter membrane subunit [Pseudomonadota bacterium]
MSALAVTPVLVPLLTAALTAALHDRPALQKAISFAGALALLGCALALVGAANADAPAQEAFGGWALPFGIGFRVDRLGAAMVLITAIMGLASLVFLESDADPGVASPVRLPLIHGLLAGVGGAFATADLFNLYVWFEVMLICSLGLLAMGGRRHHIDGAFKYMVLNLFGTLMLLAGVTLVYGASGHLAFSALQTHWAQVPAAVALPVLTLLLISFLVKAGSFPVYAWLPSAYPGLPGGVLALFAGLLTKVGAYAVLRAMGDVFAPTPQVLYEALGWVATATMIFGVLGAAYHWDMRRILAFHIISQIGYILLAIAVGGEQGNAAALFYTLHHIIVKANLFLVAAIIFALTGSYDLRRIGGLYAVRPLLAVMFAIPALSLVGIPPLSGFWSKLLVLQGTLAQGRLVWTAAALLVGMLTLYSMMKIWMEAFWKAHPQAPQDRPWQPLSAARLWPAYAASLSLAALTLAISFNPQPLMAYAQAAARTLGMP